MFLTKYSSIPIFAGFWVRNHGPIPNPFKSHIFPYVLCSSLFHYLPGEIMLHPSASANRIGAPGDHEEFTPRVA